MVNVLNICLSGALFTILDPIIRPSMQVNNLADGSHISTVLIPPQASEQSKNTLLDRMFVRYVRIVRTKVLTSL